MLNAMTTFPRYHYHLLFAMASLLANGMSKLFRFWAGKRSRLSLTTIKSSTGPRFVETLGVAAEGGYVERVRLKRFVWCQKLSRVK